MISEEKIVHDLKMHSPYFIGDDAAILPNLTSSQYVVTKDLLVEDIHFRKKYFTPQDLAHKALHVNLSDLAAMGAYPLYVLGGIAIPPSLENYAQHFIEAFTKSCTQAKVIPIGGDTTASKKNLLISITAIGTVNKTKVKYRHTANITDIICVAGNLGFAQLGLSALEGNKPVDKKYIKHFLRPKAKIKEGLWLGKRDEVTSMMDISDGLYKDLSRLCNASHKGAIIDLGILASCLEETISLPLALEGGEDYGLLFTVTQDAFDTLHKAFLRTFHYDLKKIGVITQAPSLLLQRNGETIDLPLSLFSHFGENDAI